MNLNYIYLFGIFLFKVYSLYKYGILGNFQLEFMFIEGTPIENDISSFNDLILFSDGTEQEKNIDPSNNPSTDPNNPSTDTNSPKDSSITIDSKSKGKEVNPFTHEINESKEKLNNLKNELDSIWFILDTEDISMEDYNQLEKRANELQSNQVRLDTHIKKMEGDIPNQVPGNSSSNNNNIIITSPITEPVVESPTESITKASNSNANTSSSTQEDKNKHMDKGKGVDR